MPILKKLDQLLPLLILVASQMVMANMPTVQNLYSLIYFNLITNEKISPVTYDFSANFLLYDKLWLGATYRYNFANNFGAIIDYQVTKEIRIGYAYDIPTTEFRTSSSGTHEILLIYEPFFRKKEA